MGVKHRVSKQCTVQISGGTRMHWVQLVAGDGMVSAIKIQRTGVYPFSLGIVLARSLRSEVSH